MRIFDKDVTIKRMHAESQEKDQNIEELKQELRKEKGITRTVYTKEECIAERGGGERENTGEKGIGHCYFK